MFTPPISDEDIETAVSAVERHGGQTAAAAALGWTRSKVQRHIRRAAERGLLGPLKAMPGYMLKSIASKASDGSWVKQVKEPGEVFAPIEGHAIKGESALVDADGRIIQKWVKTREEPSALDLAETLKTAFADFKPAAKPAKCPSVVDLDLLNLIPCNDWHVNLLTWGREVGQNWDLPIAERVIGDGVVDAIERTPKAGLGIVLGGGDLTHADNNENRTSKSNNVLDCDGRHQKGLEVATRLMVRTVDAALRRNREVIVRILPGNHDEHTSAAVAYFLLAWYRNEPRVTVDCDASLFFWHRFGQVMLGATHGHTVKLANMPSIMAHRRAEDWGATKFRYIHGFHIHHSSKIATEGNGCICESHQAPIPQDAWHYGAGFLSGRSLQTITYHQRLGEISRVRVAMLDAEEDAEEDAA
jgi:hypothetical protein